VRDNNAQGTLVTEKGNTYNEDRPYFAEIAQINQPKLTALNAWEGA